ncbi:hypothetical protein RJ640_013383 [Escallonia rubra]|uniref:Uncharacterized protein n=1 Tax=Escallonia rubra TaxID=112253 RepID=A0AA88RCY4_9ASTE|nr:hypothetical protein RJ640_013383 [Escallonia rubra]
MAAPSNCQMRSSSTGLGFHTYPPLPKPSFLLIIHPHRQHFPPLLLTTTISSVPSLHPSFPPLQAKWDSNAESFRSRNFNFGADSGSQDGDNEDVGAPSDAEQWYDVLEELIDGVWIFRVFRSFGWTLPAIIAPLLLATGPKAFLLALAVPIGQSALSLAFQKVWGRTQRTPKRKGKNKKKRRGRTPSIDLEEDEGSQGTRKETMGYRTWVTGNDVPAEKDSEDAPSFGGWDELDRRAEYTFESGRRSARTADGPQRTVKSKLSRRESKSGTPLLLRLLIAIFPFFGSWIKML